MLLLVLLRIEVFFGGRCSSRTLGQIVLAGLDVKVKQLRLFRM